MTMHLGITCYRDYLGTNWSTDAVVIAQLGEAECNDRQAYMSDALGVGALVHTQDDKCILIKRGMQCAEAPGLYDIPGGHPEPKVNGNIIIKYINTNSYLTMAE